MSSVSKNNSNLSFKKKKKTQNSRTRISILQRRRRRILNAKRACKCKKYNTCSASNSSTRKVSEKIEALKNLIPSNNGENVKADQLFQETADYIVLLRTQVFVLQNLIDFYGSNNAATEQPVVDSATNAVIL